jgi:hypothetical protein
VIGAVRQQVAGAVDVGEQCRALLVRSVEPGGHVAARDEQQVAGADGKAVPDRAREPVLEGDALALGMAERAIGHRLASGPRVIGRRRS